MYLATCMSKIHSYISRKLAAVVQESLCTVPVTALLGPRQCGKSTLARHLVAGMPDSLFLDLERRSDLRKLAEPEWFLEQQAGRLVVLDEVQRTPDIFTILRVLADEPSGKYRFLILGSASPDLLRQSSESLAGRIRYHELTPLLWSELQETKRSLNKHWFRGGFPDSLLADDDEGSRLWRESFIRTFIEKDIGLLDVGASADMTGRLWRMLAHYHGQTLNTARLGQALGVSHTTIRKYVGILEQTFMLRLLSPWESNLGKRLTKSPKVYIRDAGIVHELLEIDSFEDLAGHPVIGASWEGWCIEQISATLPGWRASFCRTSNGEEVDLVMERGRKRLAFEFKATSAPALTRGCRTLLRDIEPEHTWVVCPIKTGWPLHEGVTVASMDETLAQLGEHQ